MDHHYELLSATYAKKFISETSLFAKENNEGKKSRSGTYLYIFIILDLLCRENNSQIRCFRRLLPQPRGTLAGPNSPPAERMYDENVVETCPRKYPSLVYP